MILSYKGNAVFIRNRDDRLIEVIAGVIVRVSMRECELLDELWLRHTFTLRGTLSRKMLRIVRPTTCSVALPTRSRKQHLASMQLLPVWPHSPCRSVHASSGRRAKSLAD